MSRNFRADRETIIRILKVREHDALNSMAELNEENLWSAPYGPTGSRQTANGYSFLVAERCLHTAVNGGFEGGNPAGFAGGAGGINSDDYARWRNYTFGYTNVTIDDLVKKVKKAITFCHFTPAVQYSSLQSGHEPDYEILTTYRVQEPLERLAETRNDRLGSDVARFMNQVTIGGVPLSWVPYLENNDTSDPLYGINWKTFRPFAKRGCQMRRSKPKTSPSQHNVRTVHVDNWMNYMCIDRRGNWVGSVA